MDSCPYKGLMPYREQDAPYFFGRDTERRLIRDNLRASRLTILYGASGTGKSSVLGAGVAHDLKDDPDYLVVLFRNWRNDPVAALNAAAREKLSRLPGFEGNGDGLQKPGLFPELESQAFSLNCTLLVILDQFEEYFQYHPNEDGEFTFASEFPRLLRREGAPVHFLLSLREDTIATLDHFKKRIPSLFNNRLRVDFLSREAALKAVLNPLDVFNAKPRPSGPMSMREEVAQRVVDRIIDVQKSEKQCVQTPYLQLVMERWWNQEVEAGSHKMREETLRALGGVESIVDRHLEHTLKELDPKTADAVAEIFRFMVTPGGRKIALTVSELAGNIGTQYNETIDVKGLLEKLRDARVLASVPPPRGSAPGEQCFEFAHDVVARAALEWRGHYREAKKLEEAERKRAAQEEQQKLELERAQAETARQTELAKLQAESARRMGRRAVALGLLAVLACVAFVWGLWELRQAHLSSNETTSHRLAAVAVNQIKTSPELSVLLAMYAVDAKNTPEALDALNRSLLGLRLERVLPGHADVVTTVAFSPDGKTIASGSQDHTVKIWDANTGQLQRTLSADTQDVFSVAFSYDQKWLAAVGTDNSLRLWDFKTGAPLASAAVPGGLVTLACHPKDHTIATSEIDDTRETSTVRIWSVPDANAKPEEKLHWSVPGQVNNMAFSITGAALATASSDHIVRVWKVQTGDQFLELKGHTDQVMGVSFAPDGQHLASVGMDRTIRIWDPKGTNLQTQLTGHTNTVFAVAYDSAGRLASASADARVKVWDPATGRELLTFAGHTGPVQAIAFSPDGKRVASASWDKTIRIWDAESHKDGITSIAFSPDGNSLATGSRDKTVKIWDNNTGLERTTLPAFEGEVNSIAFSRDGKLLAAASNCDDQLPDVASRCKYAAGIWDVEKSAPAMTLPVGHPVNSISFNTDGTKVATGDDKGGLKIWELKIGVPSRALGSDELQVNGVAFSPDGSLIATVGDGYSAKVWNLSSGKIVHTLKGHERNIMAVDFSKDSILATASLDGTARLWNLTSETSVHTFKHGANAVSYVAFSSDGKSLATAGWDRTARIWGVALGEELHKFTLDSSVNGVAFSPDGKRLAVASESTRPQMYTLDKNTLMGQARARMLRIGRSMRPEECKQYLHSDACPKLP